MVLYPGAPEGSSAVVLIIKCLRRRGHGLKSHLTDWEKPGIEPVTPGIQGIYTTAASFFVAVFLCCTSTGQVGFR